MFIVAARQLNRRWIAGVFTRGDVARHYFASIPDELRQYQRLYEIPLRDYPVYLIEDDGFRFVSEAEALAELQAVQRVDDDEQVYFILYKIAADYRPDEPGTDHIGAFQHVHVDNLCLAQRPTRLLKSL